MRVIDIVKPVCTGFALGAALAVLSKPFKLEVKIEKKAHSKEDLEKQS